MIRLFLFIIPVLVFFSCGQDYTPKPRGFFRIDLPEKEYKKSPDILPYRFEVPTNSLIINNRKAAHELYWINIVYPQYKATIHLSYKEVDNNVDQYIKDSRGFVYKHTIKADAISEDVFIKKEKNVYGIKGDAA
jgi:gliding motility-associated lipoprotein GldD